MKYGALANKSKKPKVQTQTTKKPANLQNGISGIVRDTASNIGKVIPVEIPRGVEDVLPNIEPVKPVSVENYQPPTEDLLDVTDRIMRTPGMSDEEKLAAIKRVTSPEAILEDIKQFEKARATEQAPGKPATSPEPKPEPVKSPTVEEPVPGEAGSKEDYAY